MAIGRLSHVPEGTFFSNRRSLYDASVHRDIRRGICGSALPGRGVESIVLSGGYEDDIDLGDVIYYTGQGGRVGGKQVDHQEMKGLNSSLARNVDTQDPVRVIRSGGNGFRYDGLYSVEDAWMGPGKSGFMICRYRLRRMDSSEGPLIRAGTTTPVAPEARPPNRRLSTHYRLVRDGAIPRQIKSLYDYACQICGERLEIAGGLYAEGAHLVPLGGESNGVDHVSNVLCLCPNHHVLLDHGAIALTDDWAVIDRTGRHLGNLNIHPTHDLNVDYAREHRRLLGFDVVDPPASYSGSSSGSPADPG